MEKEALEQLIEKVGGQPKLAGLVQRRLRQLTRGSVPLVELPVRNLIEVALEEIRLGKVTAQSIPEEPQRDPQRERRDGPRGNRPPNKQRGFRRRRRGPR